MEGIRWCYVIPTTASLLSASLCCQCNCFLSGFFFSAQQAACVSVWFIRYYSYQRSSCLQGRILLQEWANWGWWKGWCGWQRSWYVLWSKSCHLQHIYVTAHPTPILSLSLFLFLCEGGLLSTGIVAQFREETLGFDWSAFFLSAEEYVSRLNSAHKGKLSDEELCVMVAEGIRQQQLTPCGQLQCGLHCVSAFCVFCTFHLLCPCSFLELKGLATSVYCHWVPLQCICWIVYCAT